MTSRIIDRDLALEQAGGNSELADELLEILLAELPQFESALRAAFGGGDLTALKQCVHKLNGAATYCGVPALKRAAEALEIDLKRGDGPHIAPGLERLLGEIARLRDHASRSPG